jgi:hypothetical protein
LILGIKKLEITQKVRGPRLVFPFLEETEMIWKIKIVLDKVFFSQNVCFIQNP